MKRIILAAVIVLALVYLVVWPAFTRLRTYKHHMVGQANLSQLGKAMLLYAHQSERRYPTADKWCDLLLENGRGRISEKHFRAPRAGRGRCHFAMNPDCEPNAPREVVLLFETAEGWNKFGGPELLNFEGHRKYGCNVLYNDGHVEFVTLEQAAELKWSADANDS